MRHGKIIYLLGSMLLVFFASIVAEAQQVEPGKWAGFIVLDRDYLTVPEEQIEDIKVLMTVLGGRVAHVVSPLAEEIGMQPRGAQVELGNATGEGKVAAETRVALSEAYTAPGAEVAMPIYLTSGDQVQVGSMEFDVFFLDDILSFVRLEPAFQGLEKRSRKFLTQFLSADGNRSTISVEISIEKDGEALLDGLMGYLIFRVADGAKLGETSLETENLVMKSPSEKLLQDAQSLGAKVTVLSQEDLLQAIAACLFYMH